MLSLSARFCMLRRAARLGGELGEQLRLQRLAAAHGQAEAAGALHAAHLLGRRRGRRPRMAALAPQSDRRRLRAQMAAQTAHSDSGADCTLGWRRGVCSRTCYCIGSERSGPRERQDTRLNQAAGVEDGHRIGGPGSAEVHARPHLRRPRRQLAAQNPYEPRMKPLEEAASGAATSSARCARPPTRRSQVRGLSAQPKRTKMRA